MNGDARRLAAAATAPLLLPRESAAALAPVRAATRAVRAASAGRAAARPFLLGDPRVRAQHWPAALPQAAPPRAAARSAHPAELPPRADRPAAAADARPASGPLALARAAAAAPASRDTAWDIRAHARSRGFASAPPPVPSDEAPAAASPGLSRPRPGPAVLAARPPRPAAPAARRRSSPWPAAVTLLLFNLLLTQVGVEALGLAVPVFAQESFGPATLATLTAASSAALALGGLAGAQAADRFGPEKTYIAALAGRAAVIAAMAALHTAGALDATALVALFSLDYVLHYAGFVALDTLAPRRLGEDPVRLNRFGLVRQVIVDAVGFAGPLGAGLALASLGYAPLFWAYPAAFALAAGAGLAVLGWGRDSRGRPAAGAARASGASWAQAARELAARPALRWSVISFALVSAAALALYFIIAPSFGAAVAGDAGAGAGAQAASLMTAFFSVAGIGGAWLQARLTSAVEREAASGGGPDREEAARAALARRMGWAVAAVGLSLLGFWALDWRTPLFALPFLGMPVYGAQLLMIPFGLAFAVPSVGLLTILQSSASAGAKAKAAGLNRAAAMAAAALLAFLLGAALPAEGGASLAPLAAALSAVGAAAVLAGWRLARSAR